MNGVGRKKSKIKSGASFTKKKFFWPKMGLYVDI
jgi:hypothetical protein